jgi:glycosidase
MQSKIRFSLQLLVISALMLSLFAPAVPGSAPTGVRPAAAAASAPQAVSWCAAGSFQNPQWNNASTPLYDDGTHGDLADKDGVYSLDVVVPSAGQYEFKAVECGNWGNAFPPSNSWFATNTSNQTVKITFDTNNHTKDAGAKLLPAQNIVDVWGDFAPVSWTAVGDFQNPAWTNNDPATLLESFGNGVYWITYTVPTAGSYIGHFTRTGFWDTQYSADGRSVNPTTNFAFTTTSPNQVVYILLDTTTARGAFIPQRAAAPGNWCVAGSFQNPQWNNSATPLFDDGAHGDLIPGDGVFSRDYTIPAAGLNEFKAVECGNWNNAFPPSNSFVNTSSPNQVVKFIFDSNDHTTDEGLRTIPAKSIVNAWDSLPALTAVGDFNGFNNADSNAALQDTGKGSRLLLYTMSAAGVHPTKITRTGGWDMQIVSDGRIAGSTNPGNINLQVFANNDVVKYYFNVVTGRLALIAPPKSGHSHDNIVEVGGLGHNSQDPLYRRPQGALPLGATLRLRFRSFHNDLTRMRVRFYDSTASREFFRDMSLETANVSCYDPTMPQETCDYYATEITPGALTTLYYRFIAIDGTDTAYYADDVFKDGAWGKATGQMVDNSYAVTVYDPAFALQPWMQNAIIYQIFPDRFRNGSLANDPNATLARYGWPDNELDRILVKKWGSPPEGYCRAYTNPATPCLETPRGRDYFGGDLAGLHQKLDYLQALGVTVIYLNPIFEASSDHLYDTRDYRFIESFFGSNADFKALADDTHNRGMKIILDGVFNHVSSDSPYFDRYHHFSTTGACESMTSPYRDWFTFQEVGAGNGVCAGQNGPDSATYPAWFGFDSLPVLNKGNTQVKDLIFQTNDAIARYWLNQGADGWRLDVMNDGSFPPGFWQSFRQAVLQTKPEAVILGELWKKPDVLPMIYGDQADSTMNYRFRNAVMGFFGTVDNKGFVDDGQSNQPPSLFASKMLSVREDYPDATYYSLMNLMGSHDTERILWGLTPGQDNREQKEFDAANLATGKQMLRMAAAVQMTVPGAPTIYYGDEIGVTGHDDPDDRRTFPWADQNFSLQYLPWISHHFGGAAAVQPPASPNPYFGAGGDHSLLDYYRKLTALRNANPVFRQGKLSFLLADDIHRTLAYLLRSDNAAALVAINRSPTLTQTVSVPVTGTLPIGAVMVEKLGSLQPATVTVSGGMMAFNLAPLTTAVFLPAAGQNLTPPAAPASLTATPGNARVVISWPVSTADRYTVLRSRLSGGGYQAIGSTVTNVYTDTNVTNGLPYFYVVRPEKNNGLYGPTSTEATATPFFPIGWAGLQWPLSITHVLSVNPVPTIYGQVYVPGLTDSNGDPGGILAQVGWGNGTTPSAWTNWSAMTFNVKVGNNYEYMGTFRPELIGSFFYSVRFSTNNGLNWTYGTAAPLTVTDPPVNTPPAAPANLRVTDWGPDFIQTAWNPVAAAAEYWLYRSPYNGVFGAPLVKLPAGTTSYKDLAVDPNITYYYVVATVDQYLNRSAYSNQAIQKTEPKVVNVTFRVRVPAATPPTDTVYLVGDQAVLGPWDPGKVPMTNLGGGIWEKTIQVVDGAAVQYKYTRGVWERVEWWGTIVSVANRGVTVSYGATGNQLVDNTATDWGSGADDTKAIQNWRDPLVTATSPVNGSTIPTPSVITVTFSRPIQPPQGGTFSGSIVVKQGATAYPGVVTSPVADQLAWTPTAPLPAGTYTVTVNNVRSNLGGDSVLIQKPYTFTFTIP